MAEESHSQPQPRPQPQPQQPTSSSSAEAEAAAATNQHCDNHRRRAWSIKNPNFGVLVTGVVFTVYYDAMYYSSGAFLLKDKTGAKEGVGTGNGSLPRGPERERERGQGQGQGQGQGVEGRAVRLDPLLVAPRGASVDLDVCGERRDSCQAYNQPNICCPVGMICYASEFSPSGVYCCAGESPCLASEAQPPRCDGRMSPCNKSIGGGCCAPNTECAAAGCLKVYRAEPGLATNVLSGPPTTITRTTTVLGVGTGVGGVTVTTAKIAETGQSDGVRGVTRAFGFTGFPSLEVFALGFAVGFSYVMVLRG
ncbi:hypothetical protein F5Y11DRAFT_363402 [Daldinia sp. FL1419]|nr:hypothetical protein F5Y11DRAFT_363402 [Daldinia sp. FL1419]